MAANQTLHFCGGMPRAGSTLLLNILNQNPDFHCTPTSGLVEAVLAFKNNWDNWPEVRAMQVPDRERKKTQVLRGMLTGFFQDVEQPIVIDKSRGWTGEIEMLERVLGRKIKMLVPVRPILDILCSFELLWRNKNKDLHQVPQEAANRGMWATLEGRCQVLLRLDEVVGSAYNRLKDALARGHRDRMCFVEFDRLTTEPEDVLAEIYDFLELPAFKHDFSHVDQTTHEDDSAYGWLGLHDIRPKVEPVKSRWKEVLAPYLSPDNLKAYKDQNIYWRAE